MLIDARYQVNPLLAAYQAAASTGAVSATAVDMKGKVGVAFHLRVTEATGLTSAIMKLQTSPNNSDWTDATFDEMVGTEDGDTVADTLDDVGIVALAYSGVVRYVKAVVTVVATDVDYNVISTAIPQLTDATIAIPGN